MKILMTILLTFQICRAFSLEDQTIPLFAEEMLNLGIESDYSAKSSNRLKDYIDQNLMRIEKELETAEDDLEEDLKLEKAFFKQALVYLAKIQSDKLGETRLYYNKALRVLYSLKSNFITQDPLGFNINSLPEIFKRLSSDFPYIKKSERNNAIGLEQAKKEAASLVDPISQKFLSTNQLAKLSFSQVANLEVPQDDPFWYQEASLKKIGDTWSELESWVNIEHGKKATKKLIKKIDDDKVKDPDIEKYSLDKARRVLFFSKIKDTASSPKINTKDAYGQTWKLKWGTEVQVEPLLNRLAMKIGAKFTDLVYANGANANDLVLILDSKKEKGSCEHVNTVKLLSDCLLTSAYEFDLTPYILHHSVITKENVDKVLANLPKTFHPEYSKETAIGREFVIFKESSVEFKSDEIMSRGGGASLSAVGATQDRAIRGNLILTAFMANIDQKDDNSAGVVVKDFKHCPEPCYIEFTHDFGAAMGSTKRGMELNSLANQTYIKRNLAKDSLIIDQLILFRPLAYDFATFSDALWMAKKIVALTKADFTHFAKFTKWPDYMQAATVQILLDRRNQIAKAFEIEELITDKTGNLEDLNISISLKTKADRLNAAKKYALPITHIEAEMKRARLLKKSDGESKYSDQLIRKNAVVSCEDSLITNLLEKYYFPTGLSRRTFRWQDDKPLENCVFREQKDFHHK